MVPLMADAYTSTYRAKFIDEAIGWLRSYLSKQWGPPPERHDSSLSNYGDFNWILNYLDFE